MKTAQTGHDHQKDAAYDGRRRVKGKGPRIRRPGQEALEAIAPFDIRAEASEDGLPLLLFKSVPIRGRNLFQKALDLAVAFDPEANHRLLVLRDIELFNGPVGAASKDERRVLLAPSAFTVRTAADLLAQGRGGPEKLLAEDEGLEARAALSFDTGHAGRSHGGSFVLLCAIYNSLQDKSSDILECETARPTKSRKIRAVPEEIIPPTIYRAESLMTGPMGEAGKTEISKALLLSCYNENT
jgi:hypothetical protein